MIINFNTLKNYIVDSLKQEIEPTWKGLYTYKKEQKK